MKRNFLTIPVAICEHAFQKRCIRYLQLYCWFKTKCSGHFKLNNGMKYQAYNELDICEQTLKKRIQWLLRKRWLVYNSRTGSYKIHSFKIILNRINSVNKKVVLWDYNEFSAFTSFVYAAIITYYAKRKYYLDKKSRKYVNVGDWSGAKIGRTSMRPVPRSYTLPVRYLCKILKCSVRTVVNMKIAASEHMFLNIKAQYVVVDVPISAFKMLKSYHEEGRKFICRDGVVYKQLPDLFYPNIILKPLRKHK